MTPLDDDKCPCVVHDCPERADYEPETDSLMVCWQCWAAGDPHRPPADDPE